MKTPSISTAVLLLLLLVMLIVLPPDRIANANDEIGFIETFALAGDREKALEKLIPGTQEYYYFHALHAQNQGRLKEVKEYLEPWIKRYGETTGVREIQNRQALLLYAEDPEESLAYLKRALNTNFNHQKVTPGAKPNLPTELDQAKISWNAFREEAFRRSNTLEQFSDRGLDAILRENILLDEKRRRDLLRRLQFPDYPRLVGVIAADLRSKESKGFGEFAIHNKLLPEQLDELAGLNPQLEEVFEFVNARIRRLRPSEDIDWMRDSAAKMAFLERLWDYADTLHPSFNSMKAHVLYRLLDAKQKQGLYPRDLFLTYLKLPKSVPYVEPGFLSREDRASHISNLNADYRSVTGLDSVGSDEPLVREYLLHFFGEDNNYTGFTPYVREDYVKPLFAEAKLVKGEGDPEKWYSLISPEAVQRLEERVDLEFAPWNQETFAPGDKVSLDVYVKNVEDLIVKVYEINTLNFHRAEKREINTDLKLDGLIANEEETYSYEEAPIRRVKRTFDFGSLEGRRGVWVVEFIGNGRSSRALIRKGRLQQLSHTTAVGTAVTILDDGNNRVENGSVWFGGKEYRPNAKGLILLPFSTQGVQTVVLADGDFSSIADIDFAPENYSLSAGFHIEREELLPGNEAQLAVRPVLKVNGVPTPVSLLKKVKLRVTTTDIEGVNSTITDSDFELSDGKESVHKFRVPPRVRLVSVELEGEMSSLSEAGGRTTCADSAQFLVNGVDETPQIADVHLGQFDGEWILEVLGKTGEALPDRSAVVEVRHRDFQFPIRESLKTDEEGRILLGALDDIGMIDVRIDGIGNRQWNLRGDRHTLPRSIHARAGDPVEIPLSQVRDDFSENDLAVLETHGGTFVRDVFDKAQFKDGLITLTGLEPGDYTVYLRGTGARTFLRVTDATGAEAGYALSQSRHLELNLQKPLQIASAEMKGDKLEIRIANSRASARVHLFATRYVPQFDPYQPFRTRPYTEPYMIQRGTNESLYVSGRDIGEEYRYILDRRAAKKFPGNMLDRPGLILNPWELSDTETGIDEADKGEDYRKKKAPAGAASEKMPAEEAEKRPHPHREESPNVDFFGMQATVVYNLAPNEDGVISIERIGLGDRQLVHIVAVDDESTAYRSVSLPEAENRFRDLRLSQSLDVEKHFTQQRNVTLLKGGQSLRIEDLRASELETYDTLENLFGVLSGLGGVPEFQKFSFVLRWPTLDDKQKRSLYSEYACHELNFFLSRKDPEFFAEVIAPYIANKRDKTFLDQYLLGSDLTEFTRPWKFSRLNAVERILLGRRLGGDETDSVRRHIGDLVELLPVDVQQEMWYFQSALRGRRAAGGAGQNVDDLLAVELYEYEGREGEERGLVELERQSPGSGGGRMTPMLRSNRGAGSYGRDGYAVAAKAMPAPATIANLGLKFAPSMDLGMPSESKMRFGQKMDGTELAALRDEQLSEALFRKLETTKEWAENNYYHRRIQEQVAELIGVNAFWKDYANWDGQGGFYSRHFPAATGNLAEMMFVLSVTDLPFNAEEHDFTVNENTLTITAKSPVVVFHEEIEEAERAENPPPILVSQNFFRFDDRQVEIDGETIDKFITDEFLTGVLYGSQIVVTNPTSSSHRLDLLLQVPQGAIPVNGSNYTRTVPVRLDPFSTQKVDNYFYFPAASGKEAFDHYPVQVAKDEKLIAFAEPFSFNVVDSLSRFDEASWEYLSQSGTDAEVLDYLRRNNVEQIDLSRIAWRAKESVDFFREVISLLEGRHHYDSTLWSYGIYFDELPVTRQYLMNREDFLGQSGMYLDCELVSIEPVDRHWYQHLEYSPLVNARTHQLGRDRKILNDRFRGQYSTWMKFLCYRPELSDYDEAGVAYYLFLQDRIEEGLAWLDRVEADQVESRLQLDYLEAYASFYRDEPDVAARIADKYADHPVERWRERFALVAAQAEEIGGADLRMTEEAGRDQKQDALAGNESTFELTTEGRNATIAYQKLEKVTVNYYEMDLEFLFSSKPFVSGDSGQFSYIKPNLTQEIELPGDADIFSFEMPGEFSSKNVLVEVVGGGESRSSAVFANSLRVQFAENYGRVQVRDNDKGDALSKIYVKVYARMNDGSVRFFKDGYTDLRGKFDYVSLNTNEIDQVQKLSILVMSDENGSLVREVEPPVR